MKNESYLIVVVIFLITWFVLNKKQKLWLELTKPQKNIKTIVISFFIVLIILGIVIFNFYGK